MWRTYIQSLCGNSTFHPPAKRDTIAAAQHTLNVEFPSELVELLCDSNGVHGEYGLGLIWSIERIVSDNLSFRANADFRELYMQFDCLLFLEMQATETSLLSRSVTASLVATLFSHGITNKIAGDGLRLLFAPTWTGGSLTESSSN